MCTQLTDQEMERRLGIHVESNQINKVHVVGCTGGWVGGWVVGTVMVVEPCPMDTHHPGVFRASSPRVNAPLLGSRALRACALWGGRKLPWQKFEIQISSKLRIFIRKPHTNTRPSSHLLQRPPRAIEVVPG